MSKTIEERFFDNISPGGNGCWDWSGYIDVGGYGRYTYKSKSLRAHRVSWEIYHGDIPEGLCVLHKCDNRCCVNPDHLFLGTIQDNAIDMCNKGRHCDVSGYNNGRSKLTKDIIDVIRSDYNKGGITVKSLSIKHGVHKSTIFRAVNHHSWRDT